MSGVLVVSDGIEDWFVANWLYEAVFRDIKLKLPLGPTRSAVDAGTEPNMKYQIAGCCRISAE